VIGGSDDQETTLAVTIDSRELERAYDASTAASRMCLHGSVKTHTAAGPRGSRPATRSRHRLRPAGKREVESSRVVY
jgi:hypothetical protein